VIVSRSARDGLPLAIVGLTTAELSSIKPETPFEVGNAFYYNFPMIPIPNIVFESGDTRAFKLTSYGEGVYGRLHVTISDEDRDLLASGKALVAGAHNTGILTLRCLVMVLVDHSDEEIGGRLEKVGLWNPISYNFEIPDTLGMRNTAGF
jgi:hypothetical protein